MYKFNIIGANADVDTTTDPEDIYSGAVLYPLQTAAATTNLKSSSANDAAAGTGARTVRVHGVDDNNRYQSEIATMDGITDVVLTHSYLDVFLIEVLTAGSGGVNAGLISAEHGATTINSMAIGDNVTKSAVITGADKLKLEINQVGVHITNNVAGTCKFELRTKKLGSLAWVPRWSYTCHGQNQPSHVHRFESPIPLDAGETAKLVAVEVSADNTAVEGIIEVTGGTAPRA